MSKLDELINQLCPDGVEFPRLDTICGIYDGTHQTPQYTESGVKFASVENIADPYSTKKYISESDFNKYKVKPQRGDVLMTRIGSIGVCNVIEQDEPLAYYVSLALLRPQKEYLNSRYLKYAIESLHGRKELRKRTLVNAVPIKINTGDIGRITISLPPLEVQHEIVRILDNFTELTAELTAKLAVELAYRKKQYEYYRGRMLTFAEDVPRMQLGEIGSVCMCKRILKSQTNTVGGVPFYKIGTFGGKANAFIDESTFMEYKAKYNFPKKGDVLISAAGTIGRTVVYDGKPAYFQDSNIVWLANDETKVLNEYLVYCYAMSPWNVSTGGTIARLYNDNILKATIPVPPLERQRVIIETLRQLDVLFNDINSGLHAEIEARQKQYEYYRDKLLTFKERNGDE